MLSTLKMKFKETELKYISLVELISNCPDYHIDNIEKIPNIKELKYFFFVMIFVSGYFLSCLLQDFSSPTKNISEWKLFQANLKEHTPCRF